MSKVLYLGIGDPFQVDAVFFQNANGSVAPQTAEWLGQETLPQQLVDHIWSIKISIDKI